MTLSASAVSKKRLDRIESYRPEVKNSASIDLEWIPYKGKYEDHKTKIFAACLCTNWGDRIELHISGYVGSPDPEKALIQDILLYLNQFPLTFGWYSTGVEVYDDNTGLRVRGHNSDLFLLHQRCIFHHLSSPVELKKTYARFKDPNKKHIDLCKVFENPIVQRDLFDEKYRTTALDAVSRALLGVGKYGKLSAGNTDICSLPVEEQMRYVRRDSELTMRLAQYNNCLVLRMMKVFAGYAGGMDYFQVCHTRVGRWYANRYQKMIESGECDISSTPNYRLGRREIGGGRHASPVKGFFVGKKIYGLDIKGQYPTIAIENNFSFDTLGCSCCKSDENARVRQETIDTINERLQENNINRKVDRYWVCRKRKGVYPIVLEQTLADRNKYLNLKKEEQYKANPDPNLIEEYQTHQIGAKLFANAGYGVFNNEYFEFANYQVAECITGEGRRIHKEMERLAESEPSNFEIVFGFTDSTFVNRATETKVEDFIRRCKDELGVTVEKTVYTNSIFYGKKNRFAGWTGNQKDEPVIKGLDGLSNSNPLWVQKWFKRIVSKLVKYPETRFEVIPKMIKEAFDELVLVGNDSHHHHQINYEEELKFTHKLSKDPHEYKGNSRTARLAETLNKGAGELVHYYETYTQEYVKSKQCWKKKKSYSVKPENFNLDEYKNLLLNKLKDSLEITGFDTAALERELIESNMISHMAMPSCGVAESMTSYTSVVSRANQVAKNKVKENMTNEIQQPQQSSLKAKFVNFRLVHPFVKWAGGKRQLLSELGKLVPRQFNSYHEPFLGGGAMFYYLVASGRKFTAYLSDTNVELVTTYNAIRDNPKGVIELLRKYDYEYKAYTFRSKEQEDYYYRLRTLYNNLVLSIDRVQLSRDIEIAALFIALNKTCHGGLYRVNGRGEFNTPWGRYKNPLICDSHNLENVSNALARATLFAGDYTDAAENAQKGDFVYLDPPYDPVSYTSNFTAYTSNGFGHEDQVQLANVSRKLSDRGCMVLLSNSDTPFIRELYSGFIIREVEAQRAINIKVSKRTGKELLISNYS